MKRKTFNITFLTSIFVLLVSSIAFGFWHSSKDTKENFTGLGASVAVSPDDQTIIFPYQWKESSGIYKADLTGENVEELTSLVTGVDIEPQFSPDGSKIVYIHQEGEEEPKQTLHIMNADGSNQVALTNDDYFVSEAVFSTDGRKIYFLNAGVYTNYSPITGARPHEFDIYSMNVDGTDIRRLTEYANYTMSDLTISSDGSYLYFQMYNDEKVEEPSDTFEENKEIFKMSLTDTKEITSFVPKGNYGVQDLYDVVFSQEEKFLAFTAVTEESKDSSLYKYELFLTDMTTNETRQLTHLDSYSGKPVFLHTTNQMLFLENYNWPGKPLKQKLWKLNLESMEMEEIELAIGDE
ncbi:hypothetical protein FZW96_00225 [Bacillus sp. BGMRC 2118]|nr:hypothetical protein FZW96_00225 [Bacillus sp. BGMRC 2118]